MTTSDNLEKSFASEQACVAYFFKKRWPSGFKCPFCGAVQPQIAAAYVVVCRYCRKQTSITAHTLMHGSKKNLVAWSRVASQFCLQNDGLSARKLQRLMELSCYQTAWSWLQKIRQGAALAECSPCKGLVIFDFITLPVRESYTTTAPHIGMALELNHSHNARARLAVLDPVSPEKITRAINTMVAEHSTLLVRYRHWLDDNCIISPDLRGKPTKEQTMRCHHLLQKVLSWLSTVYRGAINPVHLQGYLDEFGFRHNTAFMGDHLAILDHLLTGLVSTVAQKNRPKQSFPPRGRP